MNGANNEKQPSNELQNRPQTLQIRRLRGLNTFFSHLNPIIKLINIDILKES